MFSIVFLLLSSASAQNYCSSGPTYTSDTNLGPVKLQGDGSTIDDPLDCPRPTGVRLLTNLSADLTGGGLYKLVFSVTACGYNYGSTAGAWIDYNLNGIFETDENLFFVTLAGSVYDFSKDFLVPANVTYFGATRMRVQVQETAAGVLNPCSNFSFGGTKDFTVVIKHTSHYCTAGPTSPEDTHLGPLLFQGAQRDLIQYSEPCPGYLGPTNFSDILADVARGMTYPIALSVVTCRKQYLQTTSIWVDWNRDYEWTEDERVLPSTTKFGAIMGTITVPSNAQQGNTGMRVMVQEIEGQIYPCDNFKYGATQDYNLLIT